VSVQPTGDGDQVFGGAAGDVQPGDQPIGHRRAAVFSPGLAAVVFGDERQHVSVERGLQSMQLSDGITQFGHLT